MWKGGGARVGGISDYLYLNFRGQKIENLVIRSLQAFNVQSFIIFTVSFIMQTKCIQLFLQIYNAQDIKVYFLK